MSNVIAGVRLPANAVPMVRRHLECFPRARAEPEVRFLQAELVGMLIMLEQLQRLSRPGAMMLHRHVQGLADERVSALKRLAEQGEGKCARLARPEEPHALQEDEIQ